MAGPDVIPPSAMRCGGKAGGECGGLIVITTGVVVNPYFPGPKQPVLLGPMLLECCRCGRQAAVTLVDAAAAHKPRKRRVKNAIRNGTRG